MLYNVSMENKSQNINFRTFYRDDDSGKVFLICLLIPIIVSLIFSMIAGQIAKQQGVEAIEITSNMWFLTVYALINFLVYISIYLVYNKVSKIEYKAINLKFKMNWHTYLIVVAVGVVSLFGIQYFIGAFDNLLKLIGFPLNSGTTINPTDFGTFILATFVLAVLPAIGEEILFRGIVLNGLRSRFSDLGAVLFSALMFALMHGNLQQLLYPFILGSVMGWIVVRTGSLISSMIVHFTNNFLVVMFAYIENVTGFSLALPNTWWFYLIAILLLVVTGAIYFIIDRYYFKHKSKESVEKISSKTSPFIYVSLSVAIVILVLNTIASFAM